MATQNLVSAVLTPELKASINQTLEQLKNDCSFVITLTPDEIKNLFKAGDAYSSFLDKAYNTITDHPEIMPSIFDKEEFKKDYIFAADLMPIIAKVRSILETLENTRTAALSDTIVGALEIYNQVQNNKDKVSGLNTVYDDLAVHFKKSKRIKEQPKQ